METREIPIQISTEKSIDGNHPIVLIGPNGSGKTRHGLAMASWNNANIIGALRNISLNPNVTMSPLQQATQSLTKHLSRRKSQPWELSNEIDILFSKLLAEDSSAAIGFRDGFLSGGKDSPIETKIMILRRVWSKLFPGRKIDFTGYTPIIESEFSGSGSTYPAQQMSDGERVAIYLTGRVLDSDSNILIVDEPEVHFHSLLAVKFWNEMEKLKPDCRFVYITHDLPFALSRNNAEYIVIKPNFEPQSISLEDGVPIDLAETLLAAASFSIYAKRLIFCEGTQDDSIDYLFYSSWFNDIHTAVIPIGSSKNVIKCSSSFADQKLLSGVTSIGIIDRDYWPDEFLRAIPPCILVLDFHEIENLLCAKTIYLAIAKQLSIPDANAKIKYDDFIEKAIDKFSGGLLNKQISERFKRRCERQFNLVLNSLHIDDETETVKNQHKDSLKPENWGLLPESIFEDEQKVIEDALKGNEDEFLKILPGKIFVKQAAESLGVSLDRYIDILCTGLKENNELAKGIEPFLSNILPTRTLEP
jgi:energy-coupling factor transporter ATP-binding protein EcfA2